MEAKPQSSSLNRWIAIYLAGLTVFAVIAYGLTTDLTKLTFDIALLSGVVVWCFGLILQKQLPGASRFIWILCALILVYGWVGVWNAEYNHTWEDGFSAYSEKGRLHWLPSTVNHEVSSGVMTRISLLAIAFIMLIDIGRSRTNRRILLGGIAIAGVTIALIGIFQKASGAESLIFHEHVLTEQRFFASYRYHGNAATLLNFAWPISFVLLIRSKIKGGSPLSVSLWGVSFVFTFVAVFVNTSKIGQVLGLLMVPFVLYAYRKQFRSLLRRQSNPWLGVLTIGAVLVALTFFLIKLSFSTTVSRWADFDTSAAARLETYQICLDMIPTSGFFGIGPGAFSTLFPYAADHKGIELKFFWHTAHQDYLQMLIEWGFLGTIFWASITCIVVWNGFRRLRSGDFYASAILIGLLASLAQAIVDFPFQIASLQWVMLVLGASILASSARNSPVHRKPV